MTMSTGRWMLTAISVAAAATLSCGGCGRRTDTSGEVVPTTNPSIEASPMKPTLEFADLPVLAVDIDRDGTSEVALLRQENSGPLKPRAYELHVYDATTLARRVTMPLGVHAPLRAWAYVNDRFVIGGNELKITLAKVGTGSTSTEEHPVRDFLVQVCAGPDHHALAVLRDLSGSSYDPATAVFSDVPSLVGKLPTWCVLGAPGIRCETVPTAPVCLFSAAADEVAHHPDQPERITSLPADERWIISGVVQQWRTRSASGEIVLGYTAPGAPLPVALAVDRAAQKVLWRSDLPTGSLVAPSRGFRHVGLVDDIVVAVHRCTPSASPFPVDRLFAIDAKGTILWKSDEATTDNAPLLAGERIFLVRGPRLVALDARKGSVVGEAQ